MKADLPILVGKMVCDCTIGGFFTLYQPNRPPSAYVSMEADARLYAAAPDLLEACKQLIRRLEVNELVGPRDTLGYDKSAYKLGLAAIAKAEG